MCSRFRLLAGALSWSLLLVGGAALAEEAGQEDLQKAIELKANPTDARLQDMTRVIELLGSALDQGLDKDDTEFAEQLLVGTLIERADALASLILERVPDARWPQIRSVAVADLQRALGLDENQMRASVLLGRLLSLPGGDRDKAIEALTKVIDHETAEASLRAEALRYRGGLQETDELRSADFDAAVELAPGDPETFRARAMYRLDSTRFEEALADLEKALELEPDHARTHEAKGMALMMSEKYDEALAAFDRAVELDPDNASPLNNRGRVLALMGDFTKALAALDKAIEINPRALSVLLLRSQIHYQQGEIPLALGDLDRILSIHKNNRDAIRFKAEILATSERLDEAIALLKDALAQSLDDLALANQLGAYYVADKQSRRAIELFSQILEKQPENFSTLRSRGDAYLNVGQHAEAITDYERALTLEANDPGLLNNFAWVLATSPRDELRNGKRSIELAQQACELTEYKQAHILSTLAAGYAESGDFENAIKYSTMAVDVGDEAHDDQLQQELASYQEKKPWRELMEEESQADGQASDPAVDDNPAQSSDF